MPCTYIRHSFVRFYIFSMHIIQLLKDKVVVVQPYVRYVSRMLPCIHQITIRTLHCALEPSFWVADSLEITHRLIQLFFLCWNYYPDITVQFRLLHKNMRRKMIISDYCIISTAEYVIYAMYGITLISHFFTNYSWTLLAVFVYFMALSNQ